MFRIDFSDFDAALLYCMPSAGDVASLIWCYTFINRDAPPPYQVLNDCLSKSLDAGILEYRDSRFYIDQDWRGRIHAADETSPNEIESMLVFEAWLLTTRIYAVRKLGFVLNEREYEYAVTATHDRFNGALARAKQSIALWESTERRKRRARQEPFGIKVLRFLFGRS